MSERMRLADSPEWPNEADGSGRGYDPVIAALGGLTMITIFSGVLGASKTFHATEWIARYLSTGGVVATNIELKWEEMCKYVAEEFEFEIDPAQYIYLKDEQILEFPKHTPRGTFERPSLVVIDEFPLWFPSSTAQSKTTRATCEWARQSRKDFTDILLITQRIERIDLQFRELAQHYWTFRDLKKTRIPLLGAIPAFLEIQKDETNKHVIHRGIRRKDKRIFNLYHTDQMLRPFERMVYGTNFGRKIKRNINMKKYLMILLAVAALAAFVGSRIGSKGKTVAAVPSPPPPVPSSAAKVVPVPKLAEVEKAAGPSIVRETFRGMMDGVLLTDVDQYFVGQVCTRGTVESVTARSATLQTPDGKQLIVYAGPDQTRSGADPGGVPNVAEKPKGLVATRTFAADDPRSFLDYGQIITTGLSDGSELDFAQRRLQVPLPGQAERRKSKF